MRRRLDSGYFRVGHYLLEAKAALEHGDFIAMVESDLPFKRRSAQKLMAVARDQRLQKASTLTLLALLRPSCTTAHVACVRDVSRYF
jgi:hypothetical protein